MGRIYLKHVAILLGGATLVTFMIMMLPVNDKPRASRRGSGTGMPKMLQNVAPDYIERPSGRKLSKFSSGGQDLGFLPPRQQARGPGRHSKDAEMDFESIRNIDKSLMADMDGLLAGVNFRKFRQCPQNETLLQYWRRKFKKSLPKDKTWQEFYRQIGSCELYRNDIMIDQLLRELSSMKITHVENMEGGTQVKFIITYENDMQAVFKPMRFGRDYEADPNHFYFTDFERHTAEIAIFHLDKVLGFRRAVPTVGRVVNMTTELRANADKKLSKTFFYSPAGNLCFVGVCDYYCDTTHAICGSPDMKEGSFQVFLPDEEDVPRDHHKSMYRRTYSKRTPKAQWQTDSTYCDWKVKKRGTYAHGRRILDLIDLHIMDFLSGNQDRHHLEIFSVFDGRETYPVHLDNGRSFGRTDIDDVDILLPLMQCCVIRPTTLQTLLEYYSGPISLSEAFQKSMQADPVFPILPQKHNVALERRLHRVIVAIRDCLQQARDPLDVIMTEYNNADVPLVSERPRHSDDAEDHNDGKKEQP